MGTYAPVRVGLLAFDGVDELEVVGPYDVLATWAERSLLRPDVLLFSADGAGIRCAKGLRLLPRTDAEGAEPLHVMVHPGGPGTRSLVRAPDHLAWLRQVRRRTPLVASVCTGALPLAAAGLLAGRPVTVGADALDDLARLDPSVLIDTDARLVDDGDVVTSAGSGTGIDLALHLVARLESLEMANALARDLGYPHIAF